MLETSGQLSTSPTRNPPPPTRWRRNPGLKCPQQLLTSDSCPRDLWHAVVIFRFVRQRFLPPVEGLLRDGEQGPPRAHGRRPVILRLHSTPEQLRRVAVAARELAVVSYDVVPYRDKTKAVRLQIVDAAAYAQLVLENQGRTLSVQDAAVELGRLRAIPLPPRAGEDPTSRI